MDAMYRLGSDVFACEAGAQIVFLNLKADKYVCLDQETSSRVAPLVRAASGVIAADGLSEQELSQLVAAQLISETRAGDRPERRFLPIRALSSMPNTEESVLIRMIDVVRFYRSTVRTGLRLRFLPIRSIVRAERKRKSAPTVGLATAQDVVARYSTLRAFSSLPRRCLHDSLSQRDYLARYSIDCTWVFGVRLRPWGAHCWLQLGSVILNDTVDHVRTYTPIMAVGGDGAYE